MTKMQPDYESVCGKGMLFSKGDGWMLMLHRQPLRKAFSVKGEKERGCYPSFRCVRKRCKK